MDVIFSRAVTVQPLGAGIFGAYLRELFPEFVKNLPATN
jgi:hypothetical protein